MTGGDRIPEDFPVSLTGLPVQDLPGFPGGARVQMVPGTLQTRVAKTAISVDASQSMTNVNTEAGVWKLDKRYRQCQPSPNGSNTVRAFGYGLSYTDGDCYTMIQGTSVYDLEAGYVDSSDSLWSGAFNGATSHWDTALAQSVAAEDWYTWEHKGYIFFAGETSGNVKYKRVCGNPLESLYRQYEFGEPEPSELLVSRPPYPSRNWINFSDSFSSPTFTTGSYVEFLYSTSGGILSAWPATSRTGNSGEYEFGFKCIFSSPVDLTGVNYITLLVEHYGFPAFAHFNVNGRKYYGLTVHDSGGNSSQARSSRIAANFGVDQGGAWGTYPPLAIIEYDISQIITANKDSVDYIEVVFGGSTHPGTSTIPNVRWLVRPMIFGGVWQHDLFPGGVLMGKTDQPDVEYAYTYDGTGGGGASGTPESDGVKLVCDGKLAIGKDGFTYPSSYSNPTQQPWGALRMGSWIALTIPTTGAPYNSSDKINLYRRIIKATGAEQWQRITQLTNTGTPTYTDKLTDSTIAADTSTYPVKSNLVIGTPPASSSGEVTNIIAGVSWKGSNVYFHRDGRAFFSQQGNFKKVFWDGIEFPEIDPEDNSRPRTLSVSDRVTDTVITAVANDALYMFTRRSVYAMTGDAPATADTPRKMPGLQGCLGKRAAHEFGNGAVYASDVGLFYVEVGSVYTGKPGEARIDELSMDIKPTWDTFIGTSSERVQTVVVCYDGEIYCFCQNRYLRYTKYKKWIYGEYQSGHNVYAAISDPRRGVVAALTNGKVANIGDYLTDLGTNTAGSNGTAPTWTYYTKRFVEPNTLLRAICNYGRNTLDVLEATTPTVSVKGYTSRNTSPGTLTFTGTTNRLPFENFVGKETNGNWFELYLSGNNGTVLNQIVVEMGNYQEGGST